MPTEYPTEYKTAHSTISWARGCSRREARDLCLQVQKLQEGEKSSHSEIAGAVLKLHSRGGPYTKQEIARVAEETPLQLEEKKTGKIAEDPAVLLFEGTMAHLEGTMAHQDFLNWIDRNAHKGFVLDARGEDRNPILHTARCSALRPNPDKDKKMTTRRKLCSTNVKALRKEGRTSRRKLSIVLSAISKASASKRTCLCRKTGVPVGVTLFFHCLAPTTMKTF